MTIYDISFVTGRYTPEFVLFINLFNLAIAYDAVLYLSFVDTCQK